MLPSRRDLARDYGVSPVTIERAITPLLSEGLLRADDRRGTFVARIGAAPAAQDILDGAAAPAAAVVRDTRPRIARPAGTGVVGIVASLYVFNQDHLELNNYWVRLVIQSLEGALSEAGFTTQLYNRVREQGRPPQPLESAIDTAMADDIASLAVIGFGQSPEEIDDSLGRASGRSLPVVCVTSGELARPVPHLFADSRSAGYQAAECLLRSGCQDVLFLAPFSASWVQDRLQGVRSALELSGISPWSLEVYPQTEKEWVQEEDPEEIGYQAGRHYLAARAVPSGVICPNDGLAFGFLRAAREAGLTPGRDFAIIAFDDHPNARLAGLSTMRPPMQALGAEMGRLLLLAARGEPTNLQTRLRWQLIPRSSTDTLSRSGPAAAFLAGEPEGQSG